MTGGNQLTGLQFHSINYSCKKFYSVGLKVNELKSKLSFLSFVANQGLLLLNVLRL